MKTIKPLIISFLFFLTSCHAQTIKIDSILKKDNYILATRSPLHKFVDFNSRSYFRILDGFLLQDEDVFLPVNSVTKLSDTASLKKLGLYDFSKPYLILNTEATEVRKFIKAKSKLSDLYNEFNLPIILNKRLITLENYKILEALDTGTLTHIKYIKNPPANLKRGKWLLPFGVISVSTKVKRGL